MRVELRVGSGFCTVFGDNDENSSSGSSREYVSLLRSVFEIFYFIGFSIVFVRVNIVIIFIFKMKLRLIVV